MWQIACEPWPQPTVALGQNLDRLAFASLAAMVAKVTDKRTPTKDSTGVQVWRGLLKPLARMSRTEIFELKRNHALVYASDLCQDELDLIHYDHTLRYEHAWKHVMSTVYSMPTERSRKLNAHMSHVKTITRTVGRLTPWQAMLSDLLFLQRTNHVDDPQETRAVTIIFRTNAERRGE
jgi:hypothetical protein